jgi:glycosyltransferase involved in cell wall biosynthesis
MLNVSVVVPVLNGVLTLTETLNSIISQGLSNLEIVVIDGGSTDGSLDIIRDYSNHISYWETGLDSGISDAFNRGVARTTGDLVAILNCDDVWAPKAIRLIQDAAAEYPKADIYCGQILYVDHVTGQSYVRKPDLSKMRQRMHLFHPAMFVRKRVYEKIGDYLEQYRLAMDAEWCHRAMATGITFQNVNHVLAHMSLGGRSDSNFVISLFEYRRSLLEHRIATRLEANYYFLKFVFFKMLTRGVYLRRLKQKILK